ncbi:Mor transcription activator family protein [Yersinia enterocolitica]|uniref:Mor transcription activator family protein n=1 Tax=Yersinia enterocolitica TaxID=630 RepID=UPI003CFC28A1
MNMAEKSFKKLLLCAPHADISKVNKYIVSRCFTCLTDDVVSYVNRLGYIFAAQPAREHVILLKEQFKVASETFGDKFELDYFCDVGGTEFFQDFMCAYDKDFFYQEMIKFNPDFNFTGDLSKIRRRAMIALRSESFSDIGQGVSYVMGAIEAALKKIGINPNDDIGGVSKLIITTMSLMDDIGGMQLYLPKAQELNKLANNINIYVDSYSMKTSALSLKYGLSYKSIHSVTKRVRTAIKKYEDGSHEVN